MEEGITFPIMSLPDMTRGRIYNFLVQEEAMKYRTVCRQWQAEIHTFYNYNLKLDENNPHLQDILDRQRITDCTTGTFLLTPPNRTRIFKQSNVLRSLLIQTFPISPENIHALLTESEKSLKKLRIYFTKPTLRYEYPLHHFNFKNLLFLGIYVCSYRGDQPFQEFPAPVLQGHVDQEVLMFNRLVKDSRKPKLTHLSFHLDYQNRTQVDWYSSTILSTLENHSKTLRWISFGCAVELLREHVPFLMVHAVPFPSCQLEQKDWARIRKVDNLKFVWIRNEYDEGGGVIDLGLLAEVVRSQKRLERLMINVEQFELSFLQEICWNCFGTLVSIKVRFMHCRIKRFDGACLKDCKNLKEFVLENQFFSQLGGEEDYTFCNFHLLPESIEELKICSIRILTSELREISSSGFKNLKELKLTRCGASGLYEVDWEVCQKLIQLPNIRNFAVEMHFTNPEDKVQFDLFKESLNSIRNDTLGGPKNDDIRIYRAGHLVLFMRVM